MKIETAKNLSLIPDDYGCALVFREMKVTLMHEHKDWLFANREFVERNGYGVPARYYCGVNACYERYAQDGWPNPEQGARWNHSKQWVEVFADNLFLCSKCGQFQLEELDEISIPTIQGQHLNWARDAFDRNRILATEETAKRFRIFCQSRLNIPEFSFRDCIDNKSCANLRKFALMRLRRDYGWPRKKDELSVLEPPPQKEYLSWDEGYIYLIRSGEFHKIGVSKKEVNARILSLRTGSPLEIELVKLWRSKEPIALEKALHTHFKEFRIRGEWFRFPEDVLKKLLSIEDIRKEFPINGKVD
jgi:hypothetical protein